MTAAGLTALAVIELLDSGGYSCQVRVLVSTLDGNRMGHPFTEVELASTGEDNDVGFSDH